MTLDSYLNSFDTQFEFTSFSESDESKLRNLISTASKKVKPLSSKEKAKGKQQIDEIKTSSKFIKILKIVKRKGIIYKNSKSFHDLVDIVGYSAAVVASGIHHLFALYIKGGPNMRGLLKQGKIPLFNLSALIYIISEIPGPLVTKLATKTDAKMKDIKADIRKNVPYRILSILMFIIQNVVTLGPFIPAIQMPGAFLAAVVLIVLAFIKMAFAIYLGLKTNNWKKYEDHIKKDRKLELIENETTNELNSLILVSSLRENIVDKLYRDNSIDFVLNKATDFEILSYVVEGKFPDEPNGNCEILLDLFSAVYDIDFNYSGLTSTKGNSKSYLTEGFKYKHNFLYENVPMIIPTSSIKTSRMVKKEKDLSPSPIKLLSIKRMYTNAEKRVELIPKDSPQYNKAYNQMLAAQERVDHYKATGKDMGIGYGPLGGSQTNKERVDGARLYWEEFGENHGVIDFASFAGIFGSVTGAQTFAAVIGKSSILAGGIIAAGGIVAASILMVLSYKTYYHYLSDAAKKCKNAPNKRRCILLLDIKATSKRIKDLKKARPYCKTLTKSKQYEKLACEKAISGRIRVLKNNVSNMKSKL